MLEVYQKGEEIKESVLNDLKDKIQNKNLISPSKKNFGLASQESIIENDYDALNNSHDSIDNNSALKLKKQETSNPESKPSLHKRS